MRPYSLLVQYVMKSLLYPTPLQCNAKRNQRLLNRLLYRLWFAAVLLPKSNLHANSANNPRKQCCRTCKQTNVLTCIQTDRAVLSSRTSLIRS